MSNLAVLLYKDESPENKPEGIPDDWPSRVLELGDKVTLPGPKWVLFTHESYAAHVEQNKLAYQQYVAPKKALEASKRVIASQVRNLSTRGTDLIQEIIQAFVNTPFETDDHFKILSLVIDPLRIGAFKVAKFRVSQSPQNDFLDSEIQPGLTVREFILTKISDALGTESNPL
jgi:hypothetical protein